jgi:hypothetical protein
MSALPSRQREIVDNQKNPQSNKYKMTWYARARKAIIEYLDKDCSDESILDNEIERLHEEIEGLKEKDPKKLKRKTQRIQVDIDAINSFKGLHKKLGLKDVKFSKTLKRPKYLDYSGVHVSVCPDIHIITNDWEHIGCLKLYLPKNDCLQNDNADFLCAVLNHYADKHLSPHHAANPKACIVIDVFGGKVFRASQNVKLHEGKIRETCRNIRDLWPTIPNRKPITGKDNGQDEMNLSE